MQGLMYDTGDNYELGRSLNAGFSKVLSFDYASGWTTKDEKKRYAKFRIKPAELNKINFNNLDKKLKSVKPPKGRARRKVAAVEDNELIMKLLLKKPGIWDRSALNKKAE